MAEPLRHRQTKEAATDMFSLQPPRHISTLPRPCENSNARRARRNILEILRVRRTDNAADIRLDAILENCIFYISPMYEFSHSLEGGDDRGKTEATSFPPPAPASPASRRRGGGRRFPCRTAP